jgi:hypothetical protein
MIRSLGGVHRRISGFGSTEGTRGFPSAHGRNLPGYAYLSEGDHQPAFGIERFGSMVKRKPRTEIKVADGAGGMMKMEDRRFEKGAWPISFEVPVANEEADRWSRYLGWSRDERGWTTSGLGQLERAENSGTIAVIGNSKPLLEIVWERKRDGPLKVRARLAAASDISSSEAEEFLSEVNHRCHSAMTVPLYVRGTLEYEGLPWCGELWLDNNTLLAAPSLQDEMTLINGARIVHVDALLDCVGRPDVVNARQQMLLEMSLFLSAVMQCAVKLPAAGRVWTWSDDWKASKMHVLGYLEPANPSIMPVPGTFKQVPLHSLDDDPWSRPQNEISVRDDVSDLWKLYRALSPEQRLQFLQAAGKWQEAMIHWQDRPSLSFALMAVACEALKPPDADQRRNCYDVIEALLGKPAVDQIRQNPFPAQHVRGTHLHSGELHGSELIMMDFMRTYHDPSFRDAHREMARITPAAIIEWLKRRGTFALPIVEKRPTLRRWTRDHIAVLLALTLVVGLLVGWFRRTMW